MVCLRYAAVDAAIQMCADKADDEAIAVAMDEEDNAVSVHLDAAIQMCADKADDEAIAVAMDEEDNAVSVHLGAAGTARSYRRQTTSAPGSGSRQVPR